MKVYDKNKYKYDYASLDRSGMTELVGETYQYIVTTYFVVARYSVEDARKYCLDLLEYYYKQCLEMSEKQKARIEQEILAGEFKTWD